jgi:hypothetical protein
VSLERFIKPAVDLAIRLIVSIEIHATSCNSTDDRGFLDGALVTRPLLELTPRSKKFTSPR